MLPPLTGRARLKEREAVAVKDGSTDISHLRRGKSAVGSAHSQKSNATPRHHHATPSASHARAADTSAAHAAGAHAATRGPHAPPQVLQMGGEAESASLGHLKDRFLSEAKPPWMQATPIHGNTYTWQHL